jgi:oxaloacetate decarboxylase gamma subunit
MVVGMTVVFAFLSLLIFVTKNMSQMVKKFEKPEAPIQQTPNALPQNQGEIAPQTVAAISAAIHQYRQSTK